QRIALEQVAEGALMIAEVAIGFAQGKSKLYPIVRREGYRFQPQLLHLCKVGIALSKSLHLRQAEIEAGFLRGEFYRPLVGMPRLCEATEFPQNIPEVTVCLRVVGL